MEFSDLLQGLGAIIGLGAFLFGIYQYYIGEKWKKSEFAAKQLELLDTDADIAFCCIVLDYANRKVQVADKYMVFKDVPDLNDITDSVEKASFIHTAQEMVMAMTPETDDALFRWPFIVYRDSFDRFFSYLEHLNHYLSVGLFSMNDISSIEYWLREIASPRFVDAKDKDIFIRFIRYYKYTGVLKLMEKFYIKY